MNKLSCKLSISWLYFVNNQNMYIYDSSYTWDINTLEYTLGTLMFSGSFIDRHWEGSETSVSFQTFDLSLESSTILGLMSAIFLVSPF